MIIEGEGLKLDVRQEGKVVTMRVLRQHVRLTNRREKPVPAVLAKWRTWSLGTEGFPSIYPEYSEANECRNWIMLRGTVTGMDGRWVSHIFKTSAAARGCVRAIQELVARVRLPKRTSKKQGA